MTDQPEHYRDVVIQARTDGIEGWTIETEGLVLWDILWLREQQVPVKQAGIIEISGLRYDDSEEFPEEEPIRVRLTATWQQPLRAGDL